MLAKIGPFHELKLALLGQRLRAHNVAGHQVGGKLDAVEREVQRVGNGLDEQRFGQAGHAYQQAVALRKHGREHQPHHFILPHDDLADFLPQLLIGAGQRVGCFFVVHS